MKGNEGFQDRISFSQGKKTQSLGEAIEEKEELVKGNADDTQIK